MRRTLPIVLATVLLLAAVAQAQPQSQSKVYLPVVIQPQGVTGPPPAQNGVYVHDVRTLVSPTTNIRYIVGEVMNGTGAPAYAAQVEVGLYGAGGQTLVSDSISPLITRLEPSERAGFVWTAYAPPAGVASAGARVVSWETSGGLDYYPLTIVSSSVKPVEGGLEVVGQVRNDRPTPLGGLKVVVTFYDEGGRVIDVANGFPSNATIQPGEALSYRLSTLRTTAYSRLAVDAEGYVEP